MVKVLFVLFCLLVGNFDPTILAPFNSSNLIQKVYVSLNPSSIADRDKILFDCFQKLSDDVAQNMSKDLEATFPNISIISSKFFNYSHVGISFNVDSNKRTSLITGVVVSGTLCVDYRMIGKNDIIKTADLSDVVLIVLTVVRDKPPVYSFFGMKEKKDAISWELLRGYLTSGNYKLFKTNNSHFDDIDNDSSYIPTNLNDLMDDAMFSAAIIQDKFAYIDIHVNEKKEKGEKKEKEKRNGVNLTDLEWYLLIGGVLLAVVLLLIGISCFCCNIHKNRKMTGNFSDNSNSGRDSSTGGNMNSSTTSRRSNTHISISDSDSNSNISNNNNSNGIKKTSRSRSRSVIPF